MGDETVNDIIRIMTVSDKVLSTEEHLYRGVLQLFLEHPHPVPWILCKVPDA